MFDIKSLFTETVEKIVEKKILDVDDYVFMPERFDITTNGGKLSCVLNTTGRVDFFYSKGGITEVKSAIRKNPFTSFEQELAYGIYDDIVEDLITTVDKIISGKSKYFYKKVLPSQP